MFDFSRIPMMIGVSIYAFEAVGLVFTVRNSVENPQQQFTNIFKYTNILIVGLFIIFAVISAIAYGNDINEIVLLNLPSNQYYIQFFQITYAFALVMSYPLQLLPVIKIVESTRYIQRFIHKKEIEQQLQKENQTPSIVITGNNGEIQQIQQQQQYASVTQKIEQQKDAKIRSGFVRISITLSIALLAFAIPRFAVFLNLIGAIAGTSLQFILPIIMYLQTFSDTITQFKKYKLYIYFAVGIIGGISSFIFSLIELFKSRD